MTFRGLMAAAAIACSATAAVAQDDAALTTADDMRGEISEAMDAIAGYSEHERDEALVEAREALNQLDAEVERGDARELG